MKGGKVQPADEKQGKFPLRLIFPESGRKGQSKKNLALFNKPMNTISSPPDFVFGADNGDTQLSWLRELNEAGVEVLSSAEEEEERVRNATSIFEFEAETINGALVSLEQYR